MNSPFTNGTTQLKKEHKKLAFRKEFFDVQYHYYVCDDTNERFTTTELDTLNLNQVHNKYREKFGIPFIDEIVTIRKKYGLNASKMSEVLGLGVNSYRNYEAGEMPSVATGRFIRLVEDPKEFLKLLEMSKNSFDKTSYDNVLKKVNITLHGFQKVEEVWMNLIFANRYPNIFNGYRVPNLNRIGQMIYFFAKNNEPFTTALNKLMFYADFGHYKNFGRSISGIKYKAIDHGPVPENYGAIYNCVVNDGVVLIQENDFGDFIGERFIIAKERDLDCFSKTELEILNNVSIKFKNMTTKSIIKLSHQEPAWINNIDRKNRINYEYSFELIHVD